MVPHARKGHVEPVGKGCDRRVRAPELLQNAASGGVRERAERGVEVGLAILHHTVQYTTGGAGARPARRGRAWRIPAGGMLVSSRVLWVSSPALVAAAPVLRAAALVSCGAA